MNLLFHLFFYKNHPRASLSLHLQGRDRNDRSSSGRRWLLANKLGLIGFDGRGEHLLGKKKGKIFR